MAESNVENIVRDVKGDSTLVFESDPALILVDEIDRHDVAVEGEGDVIFRLFTAPFLEDLKLRKRFDILVSSEKIISHSPPLKAMLTGPWIEAEKVSLASPGICELPDDDAEAFRLLCILMHQPDCLWSLPESINIETLAQFVVLLDKYACINLGKEKVLVWVRDLIDNPEKCDDYRRTHLLWITWVLDFWEEFNDVSIQLTCGHTGGTLDCVRDHDGIDLMPEGFFDRIVTAIEKNWDYLDRICVKATQETVADIGKTSEGVPVENPCRGQLLMSYRLIQFLDEHGFWNPLKRRPRDWRLISKLKNQEWWKTDSEKSCETCKRGRKAIRRLIKRVKDLFRLEEGVCMDCTMAVHTGKIDHACRIHMWLGRCLAVDDWQVSDDDWPLSENDSPLSGNDWSLSVNDWPYSESDID